MFHGRRQISPRFSAQALLRSRMMIADAFIVPKFSTATGWKMCVLSKPAYLAALRVAAASAAEPAFVAEFLQRIVGGQTFGGKFGHRRRLSPHSAPGV